VTYIDVLTVITAFCMKFYTTGDSYCIHIQNFSKMHQSAAELLISY